MPAPPCAGVILAAGASRRMGAPKLDLEIGGRSLLDRALGAAHDAGLQPVIVVRGVGAVRLTRSGRELHGVVTDVTNPEPGAGQGRSLELGLAAVPHNVPRAAVLLADMPFVSGDMIRRLLEAHGVEGVLAAAANRAGSPGPPLVLARSLFPRLRGRNRTARKHLLQQLGPRLVLIPFDQPRLVDVDTPVDYERARREAEPY